MRSHIARLVVAAMLVVTGAFGPGPVIAAAPAEQAAQTIVHMLDYVSVDYPEFVRDGKVMNPAEYEEQREFVTQAIAMLQQLPPGAESPGLLDKARRLLERVNAKAAGPEVSALANAVRADVIRIYQLTVAPRQAPDLRAAATLYEAQCASCHGATGRGDGPLAKGMDPPPRNFHDEGRMNARSTYGLYNTISLGVANTPMRAFAEMSEADRWGLAFLAASLRVSPDASTKGEALWKAGKGKDDFRNFTNLVTMAPAAIADKGGADLAAVQAYLTKNPAVLQAAAPSALELTRSKLGEARAAYAQGNREGARQLAISAYLEGFELVERTLDNVDAQLRVEVEHEMMALRTTIGEGKPVVEVEAQIGRIGAMLDRVHEKLSAGSVSPASAFVSSLLILLREGLEAIVVLAAILAFVRKTGRRDALPYIHIGWIAAFALGAITWLVANYVLGISGASREMTEGVTALLAAAMLLYVGYWLHNKSYAAAWSSFIRTQVNQALGKQTLWAMASISFLAVFRELFEIILFYETLWVQVGPEGHGPVLGGIAVAAALLAATGWAILRYSVRLPIGPFFSVTSALLGIMAVVFVGNGTAALQEAGVVDSTHVNFVTVPVLGIHGTAQGLLMQCLVLALLVIGVLVSRRKALSASPAR